MEVSLAERCLVGLLPSDLVCHPSESPCEFLHEQLSSLDGPALMGAEHNQEARGMTLNYTVQGWIRDSEVMLG